MAIREPFSTVNQVGIVVANPQRLAAERTDRAALAVILLEHICSALTVIGFSCWLYGIYRTGQDGFAATSELLFSFSHCSWRAAFQDELADAWVLCDVPEVVCADYGGLQLVDPATARGPECFHLLNGDTIAGKTTAIRTVD